MLVIEDEKTGIPDFTNLSLKTLLTNIFSQYKWFFKPALFFRWLNFLYSLNRNIIALKQIILLYSSKPQCFFPLHLLRND